MHTVHTMVNTLKLRVHIAPVGFEIDRIVIPARKMRADKVWLIAHSNLSQDKARPFLEKIRKTLEKRDIEVKEINADRYRLFDIVKIVKEDGGEVKKLPHTSSYMHSSAVTPDGKLAIAGGFDGVLRVWDINAGKILYQFEAPDAAGNLANKIQ